LRPNSLGLKKIFKTEPGFRKILQLRPNSRKIPKFFVATTRPPPAGGGLLDGVDKIDCVDGGQD
jgi:hypothetical protein